MVPSARFELASCALQARAITRFANWAKGGAAGGNRTRASSLARMQSTIEIRPRIWCAETESNRHRFNRRVYSALGSPHATVSAR